MTIEQIVEYCYWYLEHIHLLLIPAAIFDIICWIAIYFYLKKKGVIHGVKDVRGLPRVWSRNGRL